MTADPGALRDAVLSKGLLDEAFYLANYGERIPPGEPAIDHYVRVGYAAGHLPCEAFDPVLHELRHGPAPPSDWPDRAEAEKGGPSYAELFPGFDMTIPHFEVPPGEDLRAGIPEILANPTRPVKLPTPIGTYKFRNPASSDVFAAIEAGRPFSFVRIPHGFWDCCSAVDRAAGDLAVDPRTRALPLVRRRALAKRMLASHVRFHRGNMAGDYLEILLDDLRSHPRDPDVMMGMAFKGFPTFEDSAYGRGPPTTAEIERARPFMRLFSPHDRLYDAMVTKRWAILGGLKQLPAVLRRRPLILVAQDVFGVLAERLDLPQLVVVDIPPKRSQLIRREILARIEQAIQTELDRRPGETPVVLLQAGGSLGYWFVRRLRPRFPGVIYLDVGQAINIWCLDHTGVDAIWVGLYREQFSKACGVGPAGLAELAQA